MATKTRKTGRTYGRYSTPEDTAKCIQSVSERQGGAWCDHKQCDFARGHGPDGLYCKRHAPKDDTNAVVWWRVLYRGTDIEPVLVAAHTTKTVTLFDPYGSRRESRKSQWWNYYQTFAEAIQHIRAAAESERRAALDRVEVCNNFLNVTLPRMDEAWMVDRMRKQHDEAKANKSKPLVLD